MKKTFIYLFSLISTYAFSGQSKGKDTGEVLPSYHVVRSVKDSNLKNTESTFEFMFNIWQKGMAATTIQMSYNGIANNSVINKNGKVVLKAKPGKYVFKFFYTGNYFEITTDSIAIKPGYRSVVQINFHSSEVMMMSDKPVIYVYPKESTQVKITMDLKGEFSFTYPKYDNGWSFTADPNGDISMNGKKYEYLFWDGKLKMNYNDINWNEGFVVKKEDQVKFFEDKLSAMGLNAREINDYITYWCPRMAANELNFIHFIFNEEYNEYANINVTPKPDKVFRVYMMWSKAPESTVNVSEQKLPSFTRSGFTVVEWGGTEMERVPRVVE